MSNFEPLNSVYVVYGGNNTNFVSEHKTLADEHANDMAAEFPDEGPWRVVEYKLPRADIEIARTIEHAIANGITPDELLDENSPVRDEIRSIISRA